MKYYKVYAQNCKAAQPISEVPEEKLNDELFPLVQQAIETGLVHFSDDDQKTNQAVNSAYKVAKDHLETTEIISCGDYCIEKSENVPQNRPTMCGFDTFIFE